MTSPVDICSTCSTSLASGQRRCGLWLPVRCELVLTVYCGGSTAFRQAARSPDCSSCLYGRGRAAALCYRRVRPAVRACVLQVGASWHSVAQLCLVGRYQPLLLLYANADVKPLDVSTAPDIVTRLPEPLPPPLPAVSRGLT